MGITARQLELLEDISNGMDTAHGQVVEHIAVMISLGLVTGDRLGYANLKLTRAGSQVLDRARNTPLARPHPMRRRTD